MTKRKRILWSLSEVKLVVDKVLQLLNTNRVVTITERDLIEKLAVAQILVLPVDRQRSFDKVRSFWSAAHRPATKRAPYGGDLVGSLRAALTSNGWKLADGVYHKLGESGILRVNKPTRIELPVRESTVWEFAEAGASTVKPPEVRQTEIPLAATVSPEELPDIPGRSLTEARAFERWYADNQSSRGSVTESCAAWKAGIAHAREEQDSPPAPKSMGALWEKVGEQLFSALDLLNSRLDKVEANQERILGELNNTSDFDTLLTDEVDELRKEVQQINEGVKVELKTPPRADQWRAGSNVVAVTIIGLRDRDTALVNAKLKGVPGAENLNLRFIPASRSPCPLSADYALVMRWVSHPWYNQAKEAVKDKANCIFLSHSGISSVVQELSKIVDVESQRRNQRTS